MDNQSITPAPEYQQPDVARPMTADEVNLAITNVPIPRLLEMRRQLISALNTVEIILDLPLEARAVKVGVRKRHKSNEK
jgi:hypothetical protein